MFLRGLTCFIDMLQVKYVNNIEQDNYFIKKITKLMMNCKSHHSATVTFVDVEIVHMIRKELLKGNVIFAYQKFLELVAEHRLQIGAFA
ncbi:MAG: transposase-like protein [Oceanospirillaceae bacterium]|jgi:transposase-like protein